LTPALSQLFLLALAIEALSLLLPILTQWITDEAVLGADRSLLTILALGSLAVGLISLAVGAMRSWVSLYVTTHFTLQWMTNVMARMLRLPVDFFERRHLGDVVSRFSSVGGITQTLTTSGVELVLDVVIACGGLVMMLIYSPLLALIPIASALVYAAIRWGRINAMRVMSSGYYAKQAKEQSFFLETVRGVRAIKLLNRETERRVAWTRLWADSTNAHLRMLRLNLVLGTGWSLLSTVERVGLLWLGGTLVIDHRLSLGMLFAFLAYADQFSSKTNAAVERSADLSLLGVQSERLADIVLAKPESDGRGTQAQPQLRDASLALRKVSFRYGPEEDAVLSNVTLQVRDGECLALTGASGAGKSTCMKLMLGILQPTSGQVEVGGLRLDHLGHRAYRDVFAAVLQDDQLFAGTILDNICFHDDHSDVDFAMACANKARIHDEIERMPMGYHTLVGDMGTALSGGQKQRLLLARALYKRPRILFLDEATSHLDLDNERQINEAIAALQVTRVLIAHRPQTIAIADRVVRVGGGRIVELSGSDAHAPAGHLTAIV
jgi:ATP-binding cassette subfamily B protein RaxB